MLVRQRRAFPSALERKSDRDVAIATDFKTKTTVENFEKEKEEEGAARKKRRLTKDDESQGLSKSSAGPPPRSVRFDTPKAVERPPSSPKRRRRYQRRNSKVSHMFFTAESLGLDEAERATVESDYSGSRNEPCDGESARPPKPSTFSSAPAMSCSLLSIYRRYGLSPPPSCGAAAPISPDAPLKPTVPTSRDALMSSQSEMLRRMMEAQRERCVQRRCLLDAARTALVLHRDSFPDGSPSNVHVKVPNKMPPTISTLGSNVVSTAGTGCRWRTR